MFFDDDEPALAAKRRTGLRAPPPIPETGWRPPREFPNLSAAKVIGLDTETREFDFEHGPGWGRNKSHIVGFSISAIDYAGNRGKWYFPVRHETERDWNLPAEHAFAWARDVLHTPHIPKVGANLLYDVGTLTAEGIYVQGELHDVQFAEALLNEAGQVNLDWLGKKYVGAGKNSDEMYQWLAAAYGGAANSEQRANIYRAPPRLVGPYAEDDADLPLRILDRQWPLMQSEQLLDLYRMECDLIVTYVRMRLEGVRIDIPRAEQLYVEFNLRYKELQEELNVLAGFKCDVNKKADLSRMFDSFGIRYPRTNPSKSYPNGQASFTQDWLEALEHPVGDVIRGVRGIVHLRDTFVKAYLLERHVNGRIHASFNPLRSDKGGTRSGRLSSSDPNLQNIPVRTKEGKLLREAFVPDYGHMCWEKDDYSQIEYRFLVHYAVGEGADEARARYANDPNVDYHRLTQKLVKDKSGILIPRDAKEVIAGGPSVLIKNINFGLLYGMGEDKLARQAGTDPAKAKEIFQAYHDGAPYVKSTMEATSGEASVLGYVTTILGRRSRFDSWEPSGYYGDERKPALPYELAIRNYGAKIKRAHTHKAINRRLQGSSADQFKRAMWVCARSGIYDVIGVPKLLVHDEKGFSVRDDSPIQNEAYAEMHRIMETCIPLRVPIRVDFGRGANWGKID